MDKPRITIAIDGFSSCGKSTMAKALARHIGYIYIDSGAMYRAVTLYCLDHGLIDGDTVDTEALLPLMKEIRIDFRPDAHTGKTHTFLNGVDVEQEIRSMRVSDKVSPVSAIPFVRTAMVAAWQSISTKWSPTSTSATISTKPAKKAPCGKPTTLSSSTTPT